MVVPTEGSTMYLLYGLLILAMIFFFVLPITDARTARMKLSVLSSLGVLLAVSVVVPRLLH
jgi:di/tricarboxylate transporter